MLYAFCRAIARVAMRILFRPRVKGRENLSQPTNYLLMSNHTSNWDAVVLGVLCPRPMYSMAKKEMFKNKLLGGFFLRINAFPVDRDAKDLSAIRASLSLINQGKIVMIFPEGTRHHVERIGPLSGGVALLALRAKEPVVPVYIDGYKLFHHTSVVVGEPIDLTPYAGKSGRETIDTVMSLLKQALEDLADEAEKL